MNGGKTTIQNGVIINILAHRYIHSLPREQEEIINDYLREWKKQNYSKCEISFVNEIETDFEIDLAELEVEEEIKKFNRAKIKQETKERIDEYYQELDEEYQIK